jgi:DNA-binding XRE family transcriptional regulator
MATLDSLHDRLIDGISYNKTRREVSVRFNDGDFAVVALDALKLPEMQVETIGIDEFRRGLEFFFADGSMHDVSADYITWLTRPEYAAVYPEDKTLGERVGASVAKLRRMRGLSQADLAAEIGMQSPNLSRLEAGKHVPTLDVLLRVAAALGVSLAALIGGPDPSLGKA